jgi:hypothetical protein
MTSKQYKQLPQTCVSGWACLEAVEAGRKEAYQLSKGEVFCEAVAVT